MILVRKLVLPSKNITTPNFQERLWGRYRYEEIGALQALLHPEERKIMAWMADQVYSGEGEIVDAGAFLGGSAGCFAHGLGRNTRVIRKDGRIHSYDLFRKGSWLQSAIAPWNAKKSGQSTLDVYHDQLNTMAHMLSVYPGDITKRTWDGRKIEFLMLDCSKTQGLNDHCMRMFLPNLIPGKSFLFYQGYAFDSALYWLHSTMYLLREHLEHVATVKFGGTTMFRCIKPITPKIIEAVIAQQNKNPDQILAGAIKQAELLGDEKIIKAIRAAHSCRPK
jgi:hypothetical protein